MHLFSHPSKKRDPGRMGDPGLKPDIIIPLALCDAPAAPPPLPPPVGPSSSSSSSVGPPPPVAASIVIAQPVQDQAMHFAWHVEPTCKDVICSVCLRA